MHFTKSLFFLSVLSIFIILIGVSVQRTNKYKEEIFNSNLEIRKNDLLNQLDKINNLNKAEIIKKLKKTKYFADVFNKPVNKNSILKYLLSKGFDYKEVVFYFKNKKININTWLDRIPDNNLVLIAKKGLIKLPIALNNSKNKLIILSKDNGIVNQSQIIQKYFKELLLLFISSMLVLVIFSLKLLKSIRIQTRSLLKENENNKIIDQFTGVYNRIYFLDFLKAEISRSNRYEVVFSLALFNIDGLKNINNTHNKKTGDYVIKQTAEFINSKIRDVDTLFYLYDGGFALILPNTNLSGCFILTERLRSMLESALFVYNNKTIEVTASFGIGTVEVGNDNAEAFLNKVEKLLKKAKDTGRNKVC